MHGQRGELRNAHTLFLVLAESATQLCVLGDPAAGCVCKEGLLSTCPPAVLQQCPGRVWLGERERRAAQLAG